MTDQRFEVWIARLLRAGVLIAALIVLAGGICFLIRHGGSTADHRQFHGEPAQYTDVRAIVTGAIRLDCLAAIQFGLLVLIATPVARVVLSIAAFSLERDWIYVVIT